MKTENNYDTAMDYISKDLGVLDSLEELIPYSKEREKQKWMGAHFQLGKSNRKKDRYV